MDERVDERVDEPEPSSVGAGGSADVHDLAHSGPVPTTEPPTALGRPGLALERAAARLGDRRGLDAVTEPVAGFVRGRVGEGALRDLLTGAWLGHSVHPMLTDIPIGSFTSASVLDLVGGRRAQRGANRLAALGVVSALATAASGAADWSTAGPRARRIGLVHAGANLVGVGLYARTLGQRRRGRRVRAAATGLLGMGVMTVGGFLGGHLVAAERMGVSAADEPPEDWTPLSPAALPEPGATAVATAGSTEVLLCAQGDGRVSALADRCSHAGGPLHEGEVDAGRTCVTCPWHGSRFRLSDGEVLAGPASVPQPVLDVSVAAGRPEVRRRPG